MEVDFANDADVFAAISWMVHRTGVAEDPAGFSRLGFVVRGVAGVWLYTMNAQVALLEHLCANPDVPKEERDAALDAVVAAAMTEAKKNGAVSVLALVSLPMVEARAERHGFKVAHRGLTAMVCDLRKDGSSWD